MVSAILTLAIIGGVALSGRATLGCLVLACIAALCLAYGTICRHRANWARNAIGLIFENLAVLVGYIQSCSLEQSWAIVLPATFLYFARILTGRTQGNIGIMCATLPFLMLAYTINDTDLSALLCLGPALAAPIRWLGVPPKQFRFSSLLAASFVFLCAILIPLSLGVPQIKTTILRGGEWADPNAGDPFPANLTQKASYSYSSLKALLGADVMDFEALTQTYGEAWLITPTKPLPLVDRQRLWDWVRHGGHLIVISDHTDLFGHGRVLRDVLSEFGLSNSLTAFFPTEGGAGSAPGWLFDDINIKTSNVQYSAKALPLITARWWNEDAVYSAPNFFGPLSPSADDRFGRRVISCRSSYGSGTVTVHGDSTVLANFAIFQPHTPELVQNLRSVGLYHKLWPFVPWVLLLGGLIHLLTGRCEAIVIATSIFMVPSFEVTSGTLKWDSFVWVSGQASTVFETGDPSKRLSTAYTVLGLSDRKPRWVDKPIPGSIGLILGDAEVPAGWKHVTTDQSSGTVGGSIDALIPLYDFLTKAKPIKPFVPAAESISAGSLWTDDVMGDWWFDRGVSDSRRERFQSWIAWGAGNQFTSTTVISDVWDLAHLVDYWLVLATGDEIKLRLPAMTAKIGSKVYLGRGVSAEVVDQEGKTVLLGTAATTEAWGAPYSWILVPAD
jgi:hypothetical protein